MSVYRRTSTKYLQIDFRVDGVRYVFSSETESRAKAEQIERRAKAEARRRAPSGGRRDCTVDEAAFLYWDLQASGTRSADETKRSIRRVVLMAGADTMCSTIGLEKMLSYRRSLRNGLRDVPALRGGPKTKEEGKYSAATINRYLTLLFTILRHAEQVLKTNFPDLPKPSDRDDDDQRILEVVHPRKRYLRPEEEDRLEAASEPDLLDMWKFDLETGLRASNLCELRWGEVDRKQRKITVNLKAQGSDLYWHEVDLSNEAMEILRRREGIHPEFVFTLPCRHDCWFEGNMRKAGEHIPVSRGFFYKRMSEAWTKAKIKNLIVHDFRRTAARRKWSEKDIYAAQLLLGHRELQTTANYIGLTAAEMGQALRAMSGRAA